MDWQEIERRLKMEILPGRTYILKADGKQRRRVISNNGHKISMQTGSRRTQTKAITHEMIKHAFDILKEKGRFDSNDFRVRFDKEYLAGQCRFSMTGGVLVELGIADIVPAQSGERCNYILIP